MPKLIDAFAALGKRTLFVAEKRAAIEAVTDTPGDTQLPLRTPGTSGNADDEIRDRTGIPYPNAIQIPVR